MKCIFQAVCWVTPAKTMVIRSLQIIVAYAIQVPLYSRKCQQDNDFTHHDITHLCFIVKSFDSALENLIIICRKIKIPIFQVFAFGTAPHLEDLAGAACIIVAVFAMFAEDTIMAKVPWRFL